MSGAPEKGAGKTGQRSANRGQETEGPRSEVRKQFSYGWYRILRIRSGEPMVRIRAIRIIRSWLFRLFGAPTPPSGGCSYSTCSIPAQGCRLPSAAPSGRSYNLRDEGVPAPSPSRPPLRDFRSFRSWLFPPPRSPIRVIRLIRGWLFRLFGDPTPTSGGCSSCFPVFLLFLCSCSIPVPSRRPPMRRAQRAQLQLAGRGRPGSISQPFSIREFPTTGGQA